MTLFLISVSLLNAVVVLLSYDYHSVHYFKRPGRRRLINTTARHTISRWLKQLHRSDSPTLDAAVYEWYYVHTRLYKLEIMTIILYNVHI